MFFLQKVTPNLARCDQKAQNVLAFSSLIRIFATWTHYINNQIWNKKNQRSPQDTPNWTNG